MAYATLSEFKTRLGSCVSPPGPYEQLTDRVRTTTADDVVGQEVLDAAHGDLHARIAGRYAVPLDVTNDPVLAQYLKGAVLVLAAHLAWVTHPLKDELKKPLAKELARLDEFLECVRDGKAPLPSSATIPGACSSGATAFGNTPTFNPDTLSGF